MTKYMDEVALENVVAAARMVTSDLSAFVLQDCFTPAEESAVKQDYKNEEMKSKS